jgi:hypothetical protein
MVEHNSLIWAHQYKATTGAIDVSPAARRFYDATKTVRCALGVNDKGKMCRPIKAAKFNVEQHLKK